VTFVGQVLAVTTARKLLASLATVAAASALMLFGTVGEMTAENAGITRTALVEHQAR